MRRLLVHGAACLALVTAGAPAFAQMRPASAGNVVDATRACMDAVGPQGVDETRLISAGWERGSIRSNGADVAPNVHVYGREGNRATLMIPAVDGKAAVACIGIARVSSERARDDAVSALTGAIGQPNNSNNGDTVWLVPGHLVQLSATGDRSAPGIRIAVAHYGGTRE